MMIYFFFFSSRRRHTRWTGDWSSDVCSSDLVTVAAAVSLLEPAQRAALRPALLGAVTYTSNWWQAFAHQSYFTLYGPPPTFQHLWSLAVEEQFYLIWPLLLAVILLLVRR